MFKPALRWIARLVPIAAALLVSVAVGASTRTPEASGAPALHGTEGTRAPLVQLQSVRFSGGPADMEGTIAAPLIAQADSLVVLAASYPVETLDTALTVPVVASSSRADVANGFEWPRPDRGTALLATLALVAFFFLRRIV